MIKEKDILPMLSTVEIELTLVCPETKITNTKKEICRIVGVDITPDAHNEELLQYKLDVLSLKNRGYTSYCKSKFIWKKSEDVKPVNLKKSE
jgi:hypothetical protein